MDKIKNEVTQMKEKSLNHSSMLDSQENQNQCISNKLKEIEEKHDKSYQSIMERFELMSKKINSSSIVKGASLKEHQEPVISQVNIFEK